MSFTRKIKYSNLLFKRSVKRNTQDVLTGFSLSLETMSTIAVTLLVTYVITIAV